MKKIFAVPVALALFSLCASAQAVVNIETVAIGDAGNAADTQVMIDGTTGYGTVNYNYNIGKYEVTAEQYCEFLNAKAATDSYGLYNASMWSDTKWGCQIQRSGSSGSYTYSVTSDYANRPVNYVSWYDTLRFANWLTNGQGDGDTESGSYTMAGGGMPTHTPGATPRWFLASENEWYKAAYYRNGVYSLYANGTGNAPLAGMDSNYNVTILHTWDGSVSGTVEQNGTKDMMGNTSEWNETSHSNGGGVYCVFRGGSFVSSYSAIPASYRNILNPQSESGIVGFRVSKIAPVAEPSALVALAGGLVGLAGMRRRRA